MPVYVYEVILPDGSPGPRFEIKQKISDPPLGKHPETGEPVRRIIQPPNLPHNRFEKAFKKLPKQDQENIQRRVTD